MKVLKALIDSNIYISLAAVFLTIATQIQLGLQPQVQPYLFIIFFGTFFEYNINRVIVSLTNMQALYSKHHMWVVNNLRLFYLLVSISVVGLVCAASFAREGVLIVLVPMILLTLLYSIPVLGGTDKKVFGLRKIPYLKIFLIALVWSASTVLLPVIASSQSFPITRVLIMLVERFLFIFAITIPFDIRDADTDKQDGLKTLPLLFSERKSWFISHLLLFTFFIVALIHYSMLQNWFVIWALAISALSTFIFLYFPSLRKLPYYHYAFLDGTMLFQGALVLFFYYFI